MKNVLIIGIICFLGFIIYFLKKSNKQEDLEKNQQDYIKSQLK